MVYALIENNIVVNLIWLLPTNADDFPNAVNVGNYAVQIGDGYIDGVFYRNGEPLKSGLEILKEEMADMKAALAELGVTEDE